MDTLESAIVRRSWRVGWGCDCDGIDGEVNDQHIEAARGWRKAVEVALGHDPGTCPYRAFQDPEVIEVLSAYRWFETGQVSLYAGDDPNARLVAALGHYHGVRNRILSQDSNVKRKG